MKKTATIPRNSYGEVIGSQAALLFETTYPRALDIIKQAAKQKLIPASYDCITWDHKRRADGEALHHELYDFAAGKVLVCLRRSQGNGKYGVSTTSKQYIILTRSNGKISVIEADKNRAAKLAKSDLPAGGVIAALTGAKPAKIKTAARTKTQTGYKLLTRNEAGELVSVWDGSAWPLKQTRCERATKDHNGGFYYYASLQECLDAAWNNDTFGDCRDHKNLIVAQVKADGLHYEHRAAYGTKLCATRITPLKVVAMTLPRT
jgi:hypothetical protein